MGKKLGFHPGKRSSSLLCSTQLRNWYIDCASAFQAEEKGLIPLFRSSMDHSSIGKKLRSQRGKSGSIPLWSTTKYQMREFIRIVEGRTAPLFHGTEVGRMAKMVATDTLGVSDGGVGSGRVSLSRSSSMAYAIATNSGYYPAVLMLDQERLAQRYKIAPFHDEAWAADSPYGDDSDMHDEQEEVVQGIIKPLSRYLLSLNASVSMIEFALKEKELPFDIRCEFKGEELARAALVALLDHPLFNKINPRG